MPGLNAAFIDVGFEKDAFLHYTDLSPYAKSLLKFTNMAMAATDANPIDFSKFDVEPEIVKTGKISEVLGEASCIGADFKRTYRCKRPPPELRAFFAGQVCCYHTFQ